MPTSPSPRRGAEARGGVKAKAPAATVRSLWPRLVLIGALAVLAVAVIALPASMVARFLPGTVHAEDFSGSVWHGSAGRITVQGREAGALEWRLHPAALLRLHVAADLHWVKGGFVLDGTADIARHELTASNVEGGGPISDLRDFGLGSGWRGTADVRIKQLAAAIEGAGINLSAATGVIAVSDLSSPQVAGGADLGGYTLQFANTSLTGDADATATLSDTGGPLSVDAAIRLSPKSRSGLFSGTVKERADAPAALRTQVDNLAQLHARDAQGRVRVDLEFTF
jgi:Type II secretion system (T2SS), protein N